MNDNTQLKPIENEKNISVKQLQSLSSKLAASKPLTKEVVKALEVFIKKATNKLGISNDILVKPKSLTSSKTNPDQYKQAWNQLYKNSQPWRQHEIDRAVADKTFGDKDWDKDFIAQIISLAESNS
jgi:hypothetical protein